MFTLLNLQSELINVSKSDEAISQDFLSGNLQYLLVSLRKWYLELPDSSRDAIWSLHTQYLYFVVPFFLFLEYVTPAKPEQPLLCAGFFEDSLWFVIYLFFKPLLFTTVFILLKPIYDEHLSFLSIQALLSWPLPLQILAGVVLSSFFTWVCHVVIHKVAVPWEFHAVHHSQEQMNIFTADRAHPVDLFFQQVITFIPLLMFQIPALPTLPIIYILIGIWQRLIHANVQIDFGIFNYLLVSPQFHRVHHSKEERHRDKNFGVFLSIWDHLFGTAYQDPLEYPDTGIIDSTFPSENRVKKTGLIDLIYNICRQLTYPFEQLFNESIKIIHSLLVALSSVGFAPHKTQKR